MIGGVSWHSTAKYYSKLNELAANHYGAYASCECIVNSLDFAKVYEMQRNNDWNSINTVLGSASQELLTAGAEKIILCTNTYHKVTEWQEHLPKDCFIDIAPTPLPRHTELREIDPGEDKFSGFVFKIHANMDPNHRNRLAFVKICSGKFQRNTAYLHVRNGKNMKFSSPTAFMAEKKTIIDEAYPGDIVGIPDTGNFKIGDTITQGEKLNYKGLPSFSPELFRYIENADPMKSKQLAKGIDQLMDEGVAQLFVSQFNGRKVIGTVGALQFEVIEYRLLHEYGAKCRYEPINLYKACWLESDNEEELNDFKKRKLQYMAKDKFDRDVFMADSAYMLQMAQSNFKNIKFHFTSEF